MADVKISQLPAATTPVDGTEVLPIVQSATTKQVSIANLTAGRAMSATSLTLTTPLAVTSGGTGLATTAQGTLLSSTALNTISATATPTLGVAGTTAGSLSLSGVTSGVVTINTAAAAGTWSMTLPTTGGTNGYILTTNGAGVTSWTNPTALGVDLDVGGTAVTGGTDKYILYNNNGTLGNYAVTGTGTTAVLSTAPTFTTSLTTPLAIGGTTASSSLTLQSTSGVGTSDSILFKVGNNGATQAMTLTSGGDLGIGTTGPAFASGSGLHIERAGVATVRCYNSSSTAAVEFRADASGAAIDARGLEVIRLLTGGGERARITSAGDLLVGTTTSGNGKLKVVGGGYTFETGGNVGPSNVFSAYLNIAGNNGFAIQATSTSGLGAMGFYNPNGQVGSIVTNGSATTYNTSSDIILKENITPANSALASMLAFPVDQFDWKAGGHTDYGCVAQKAINYAPEIVTQGDIWSVDYGRITPRLIKAFQELAAKVTALEAANG